MQRGEWNLVVDTKCEIVLFCCRFLQGPEIPERQLYREPPEAFLEADNLEVRYNIFKRVLLIMSVHAVG